jgi:hypothetical protein
MWYAFNWEEGKKSAPTKGALMLNFWLYEIRRIRAGQYILATEAGSTWFIYNSLKAAKIDGWEIKI